MARPALSPPYAPLFRAALELQPNLTILSSGRGTLSRSPALVPFEEVRVRCWPIVVAGNGVCIHCSTRSRRHRGREPASLLIISRSPYCRVGGSAA